MHQVFNIFRVLIRTLNHLAPMKAFWKLDCLKEKAIPEGRPC